MKSKWPMKLLGEMCPISNRKPNAFEGERRYFSTGTVGSEGELSEPALVDFANRPSRAGSMPAVGEVGFARMKGTKKAVLIDDALRGALFSTGFCFIAPGPSIEPRFAFYFVTSDAFQNEKNSRAGDGIMGGIKNSDAAAIKMPIPPLAEQQRIVRLLDEAFEGIAIAKANAEANLLNTRELFNSYLVGISGPQAPLGDVVNITTGKLDANAAVEGGKYPFFTCARETFAIDEFAFDCEALLLAGNNAVGDFGVKHYEGKFNAYQRTYVITVNEQRRALGRFLYYELLKSVTKFRSLSVGAGTKFLKIGMIKELQVSLPEISEQYRLVSLADQINEHVAALEDVYAAKLAALDELKRSLLHQAFSGTLTAKTADLQVAEVA